MNLGARHTSLRGFTNWWWRNGMPISPPDDAHRSAPATQSLVLFREGQFQLEQITLLPGFKVPKHMHPNVRTYECHLVGKGDAWLRVDGAWRKIPYATNKKRSPKYKRLLIEAGQGHYGEAHNVNVAMSFQHWLNGVKPTFIADDWQQEDHSVWKGGLRDFT